MAANEGKLNVYASSNDVATVGGDFRDWKAAETDDRAKGTRDRENPNVYPVTASVDDSGTDDTVDDTCTPLNVG